MKKIIKFYIGKNNNREREVVNDNNKSNSQIHYNI